jgi:hypothetical protein
MAAFVIPAGEAPWATAISTFSAASRELRIKPVSPGKVKVTPVARAALIKSLLFITTPLYVISFPLRIRAWPRPDLGSNTSLVLKQYMH